MEVRLMHSFPSPHPSAEQAYSAAKTAAEVRYQRALGEALTIVKGGNLVRAAARKRAEDRYAADLADAQLIALYCGNPVVDAAEQALRAFGDNVARGQAARLLQGWKYTPELSVRERQAVLARFPVDLDDDGYPYVVPMSPENSNSGPGGAL